MNESENKYMIFYTAGRAFAMSFSDVLMIIPAEKPERVPDFPDYADGTVVNNGVVYTVINLRTRFGFSAKQLGDRDCLILCSGEKRIALLCDSITGFREVPDGELQPAPDINPQANPRFLKAAFLIDGTPCHVITPELIVKPEDEERIEPKEESGDI